MWRSSRARFEKEKMSIISLQNISRKFGEKEVLRDLSLDISRGEIFGLVGLNGAGKTTLIKTILGLIARDKGEVTILGADPYGKDVSVLSQVGTVLEHNGFYGNLNVIDNLKFYAKARNLNLKEFNSFYDEFVAPSEVGKKNSQVKFFSRGEKMQCALFRAFMGWPKLLIFDEPTLALDMDAYSLFISMCKEATNRGASLFISSHHLEAIDQLCDRIGLLENGTVKIIGNEKSHHTWSVRILKDSISDEQEIRSIIESICSSPLSIEKDLYTFRVEQGSSDSVIPKLIKALVEKNYSIAEVRPEIRDIKTSLKNFGSGNI